MNDFWTAARRMLRYRSLLAMAISAAVLSAVGLGAGMITIAPIIDALIGKGRTLRDMARDFNASSPVDIPVAITGNLPTDPFTAVVLVVITLVVLTILGATANFLHLFLSMSVVERTVARTRRDLFHAVLRMPYRDLVARGSADAVSRVVNDPQQLGAGLSALLSKGVAQVSKGIAAFAVALIVDARLTIITLLVAPIMYHVIRRLGKKIRRASRAALTRQADLYAATSEALQGLRVVRSSNAERFEMGRFHRINKDVFAKLMSMRTARAISSPTTEAIAIVVLAVLALIAVKAVGDGELDPTDMVIALAALGISGASLRPLTGIVSDIQQSTGAAQRIEELLRMEQEPGRDRDLPRLPRHAGSIAFEHVSLTYPNASEPAISRLSLEVPFGTTLAIVGPNGSGKTSLLSLIPRLFDPDPADDSSDGSGPAGRVLVDGVDIATVSARSLRDQIGVVSQETVLFKGTIAENIAYAARPGTVTHEAVVAAAKGARAHDFITEKGGYDTPVGERGLTLSGGQRQRIAIARAILRNPAILLLDEATSMIDSDSEARINEALREFAEGRTCLVVAHRLSTVLSADRIAVLDRGRLVDHGTHAELMDRCETYRVLAERQLAPAAD